MEAFVAPLAVLLEGWLGYSQRLVAAIGHPVIWYGKLIDFLETRLNRLDRADTERRQAGLVTLAVLLGVTLAATLLILQVTARIPQGWIIEALLATPFLAQKELGRAVKAVAEALGAGLPEARAAVGEIVGRDTAELDESGISRAAIETLAESTSDGVIAPLFWLIILGLPGIALYKAINTADSMIGHRTERYRDFGWASAKLDDLVNWVPARLSSVLITAACFCVRGTSPSSAWGAAIRDARNHDSPNAGWPEAAMAGALGIVLGGARFYEGVEVDLPAMGDGRRTLTRNDIRRALHIYGVTLTLTLVVTVVIAALRFLGGF
ncbi:MAG TPA: adenosylcobinamide-phosphate synthase CbiB [Devosiaceae bacterium]|jgi:adenosylcobinamide-phosphate synthase